MKTFIFTGLITADGLNVVLNKTGDYVFQVQNIGDKDIQTNIKIEIQ